MARTEVEALRDDAWQRSARPEIKQLMDSLLGVVAFLDLVARGVHKGDLGPALTHIEHTITEIRRATDTPREPQVLT